MGETFSISATALRKTFGDVTAVKDLSLNIRPGEIYGFLGLNGAGKTTTIRMLLGMARPSSGTVSLFGTEVKPGRHDIWQRVGYLVETPHAYPDLTVRENLDIVRRLRHLRDTRAVELIIEELSLAQYADRKSRHLSLGNAQRMGLAKALIHHPDLLILDEPSNGLDPAGIVEIRNLLRSLAEKAGVTIFISSHILSEVARLATRIGVIHQGKLVKELQGSELAAGERRLLADVTRVDEALLVLRQAGIEATVQKQNTLMISDSESISHPERIATLLVQGGSPPSRLVVDQQDLESYFLNLVGAGAERQA
jgi:ABC-2 type transport system ATP-binding protein